MVLRWSRKRADDAPGLGRADESLFSVGIGGQAVFEPEMNTSGICPMLSTQNLRLSSAMVSRRTCEWKT